MTMTEHRWEILIGDDVFTIWCPACDSYAAPGELENGTLVSEVVTLIEQYEGGSQHE